MLTASKIVQKSNWDDFYKKYFNENCEDINVEHIRRGDYPELIIKEHYEDICDFIVEDILQKIKSGYEYCDFGVLYLSRKTSLALPRHTIRMQLDEDIDYVTTLRARLASANIEHFWLTEGAESKKNYDQFRKQVTISTIFSAKGLEFEIVYLVGLELFPWPKRNERENASILYVGMTRAKTNLFLLSTEENIVTKNIRQAIKEVKEME